MAFSVSLSCAMAGDAAANAAHAAAKSARLSFTGSFLRLLSCLRLLSLDPRS
jgi:hypothetical protein